MTDVCTQISGCVSLLWGVANDTETESYFPEASSEVNLKTN